MKKILLHTAKLAGAGFLLLNLLAALLCLTCLIPKSAVQENLEECLPAYEQTYARLPKIDKLYITTDDVIADARTLNMIAGVDSTHPVQSMLYWNYYEALDATHTYGDNMAEMVSGNVDANTEYGRYWHGMNGILRILLVFLTVGQIKVLGGIVLAAMIAYVLVLLLKKKMTAFAVSLVVALAVINVWASCISLEYLPAVFLMLAGVAVLAHTDGKHDAAVFMVLGMVTAFFDFFTAETVTFCVPMALALYLSARKGTKPASMGKMTVRDGLWWCGAYAGTFLYKWLLMCIATGDNYFRAVQDHVEYYTGQVTRTCALRLNIGQLFPWFRMHVTDGMVMTVFISFLIVWGILFFLFRRKECSGTYVLLMAVLAAVPYVRYLVLPAHAAIHYFFTYRAQVVTILVVMLLTATEMHPFCGLTANLKNRRKRRGKR